MLDIHTHIGPVPYNQHFGGNPKYCDPGELVALLEAYEVEGAIAFASGFSRYFKFDSTENDHMIPSGEMKYPFEKENETVLETVEEFDRLSPALVIGYNGEHSNEQHVRELLASYDVAALKLHTLGSHSDLFELPHTDFLDIAANHDLPLICHLSRYLHNPDLSLPAYGSAAKLPPIARDRPDVTLVGAHAGGFYAPFLRACEELPNLFFDTSPAHCLVDIETQREAGKWSPPDDPLSAVVDLVEAFPAGVLWGSDFPWSRSCGATPEDEYRLLEELPAEIFRTLEKNNEAVFPDV